jgi:heme/copper-type cytochrome/quinol oxidase subunit 4
MLIYLYLLCVLAVITFVVQLQAFTHSNHEELETDFPEIICAT